MSFKKLSIPPPLIIFQSYFAGCPFYYRRGLLSGKKFFQALYYGSIISAKPTITPVLSSPFLSFVSVSQPTTIRPRELLPLHNGTKCFCITSVVVFKSRFGVLLGCFPLVAFLRFPKQSNNSHDTSPQSVRLRISRARTWESKAESRYAHTYT